MEKRSHDVTGSRDWCCLTEGSSEHSEGMRNFFSDFWALSHPELFGSPVKTTIAQQLTSLASIQGQGLPWLYPSGSHCTDQKSCSFSVRHAVVSCGRIGQRTCLGQRRNVGLSGECKQEGPSLQGVAYPPTPLCCYWKGHMELCHLWLRAVGQGLIHLSPDCHRRCS